MLFAPDSAYLGLLSVLTPNILERHVLRLSLPSWAMRKKMERDRFKPGSSCSASSCTNHLTIVKYLKLEFASV